MPEPRAATPSPEVILVDNVDSFTHNVAHALREAGASCRVVSNAVALDDLLGTAPAGIVIGPGPCTPTAAGITLALLRAALAGPAPPVLGVCLGHQALAMAMGGRVVRSRRPMHGRRVRLDHDGLGSLAEVPPGARVVRYNSLTVEPASLPEELVVAGRSEEGEIMALRHRDRPLEGVQFHPESWLDGGSRVIFRTWVRSLTASA